MKKILGMLALALLMGCDDGDMTFRTFDFSSATVQTCTDNNLIYKVNGTEALLLTLAPTAFVNVETAPGVPRVITLDATNNRVVYRNYNGPVSTGASGSICADIPPSSPSVIEEWVAQPGGTINITTTKVLNNEGELTGYSHSIELETLTFVKDDGTIIIQNNNFGTYSSPITYRFDFLDEESTLTLQKCPDATFTGLLFNVNGDEALILNLTAASFPGTAPAVTTIDLAAAGDLREVIFNEYNGSASAPLICNTIPPISPIVTKQWEAVSGELRITSTVFGAGIDHVVTLHNVVFQNRQIGFTDEKFTVGTGTAGYRLGKFFIAN